MALVSLVLNMTGGLCMFLFGMKIMSDGLQKSAGKRMRKTLNFMTGNRFVGILTGFLATAIIQSSSAFTVIVVSFVNAGLITLTQSIGVIFGTNIGTTLTGWIISLIGFKVNIDSFALPAIGVGFILSVIKWKHRSIGDFLLGFGFLFLGLHFLTSGMGTDAAKDILDFDAIGAFSERRFLAILIGFAVGLVMTVIINSSTATVTLIMALAFQGIITYEMAAGMVLGSNLGTTTNAPLASIAGNTESRRTALVHVLFNGLGSVWALPLLIPLLNLVNFILPGNPWVTKEVMPLHIAGLHTVFNIINTLLFLPFVKQFAKLVTLMIPEKIDEKELNRHYRFAYLSTGSVESPEINIMRVEKEIRDMAGIVSFMYSRFSTALNGLRDLQSNPQEEASPPAIAGTEGENSIVALCNELEQKEQYIDEMREALSGFLIECTKEESSKTINIPLFGTVADFRKRINTRSTERRVASLLRIIANLEEMSDECYSISRLLEKSVRKNCVFKEKEMDHLIPYVGQVEEFLGLLKEQFGQRATAEQKARAAELEKRIDKDRKKLNKLGRKRIEAGGNVKTELIFIDLVRRIEKLGDYCFDIAEAL